MQGINNTGKLSRPDLSYAKVLVVDDFQANLDTVALMLRKYKMQVDCVTSGEEALNIIKDGQPVYNVVFMDHVMPGMDGVEATRLIRALNTEYAKNVTIIALTADEAAGGARLFLENGFNELIYKPIDVMTLDSLIRKWIHDKPQDETEQPSLVSNPIAEGPEEDSQIEIPGINAEHGLDLFDGEIDMYLDALRSYVKNAPKMLQKMRDISEETLPDYTITVHGLKSASAFIGAEKISEKAKSLEIIAKAGNLSGVLAENENLLKDADTLVNDILYYLRPSSTSSKS